MEQQEKPKKTRYTPTTTLFQIKTGVGQAGITLYSDIAPRKSRCRICSLDIVKGSRRLLFEWRRGYPSPWRVYRYYMHFDCFEASYGEDWDRAAVRCGECGSNCNHVHRGVHGVLCGSCADQMCQCRWCGVHFWPKDVRVVYIDEDWIHWGQAGDRKTWVARMACKRCVRQAAKEHAVLDVEDYERKFAAVRAMYGVKE